ncbi:hypothetical protein CEXT_355731 [Caerostris extrusa]|uniref:SOUL heme-binding protein n=1 Tax=Caerostris extrusa TaxID=172846 RepID=A0AAV4MDB5_CAEEX|nr:hypothetical protein CEXT_355731 [Caerostris extrusa]
MRGLMVRWLSNWISERVVNGYQTKYQMAFGASAILPSSHEGNELIEMQWTLPFRLVSGSLEDYPRFMTPKPHKGVNNDSFVIRKTS